MKMRKPGQLPIEEYDYALPGDRIAKYPVTDRAGSSLLLYRSGKISKRTFRDISGLLEAGDKLYFNVTRVVRARLLFRKPTGGRIEVFILEPHAPGDYQLAFASQDPVEFICLVGNAKKWKDGPLFLSTGTHKIRAEMAGRTADKFIIRFSWDAPELSFAELLEQHGSTPIPPYLEREAEIEDSRTYQTVYASQDGSVAAPTAGLHFTNEVLEALDRTGISRHELTLHVGAGTFVPVKDDNAVDHPMHAEMVTIGADVIRSLSEGHRRIAVGTTSTRTLESVHWLGVKALMDNSFSMENLFLDQWEAYELDDNITLEASARALLKQMEMAGKSSVSFRTRIMITPGYTFKAIDGLVTNFHQPKSTLLLLIAALVGDDWKKIYEFALENGFRFLSYGDSSLLLPQSD